MNNNEVTRQILGIVGMSYKDDYSASVEYKRGNVVVYDGSSYVAKKTTRGNLPTNSEYFQLIARKPIKGTDYFTQEDIDMMVERVTEDAESEFNRNVIEKTNEFNSNATSKTSAFDLNSEQKTTTFNSNASSKTSDFNTNATNKTSAYNSNAESKVSEFNTNASAKTTSFDTNASDKTTAFNSNATSKTNDYDTNASTKLEEYNTNHTAKLNEYNTNTSNKLSEYNTNAENKVEEFDEHVDELEERVEVLETVIDGLPKVEGEGTDIQLKNTIKSPLKMKLDPSQLEQETTNGYQLLNQPSIEKETTTKGITYKSSPNGEITITGTAESGTQQFYDPLTGEFSDTSKYITLPAGNYVFKIENISSIGDFINLRLRNGTTNIVTTATPETLYFTLDSDTDNFNIYFYTNGGTTRNCKFRMMLEKGTIEHEWEPYTNGASPNPDYPQQVKRIWGDNELKIHNKNWFNFKLTPTINNSVGQITILDNGVRLGNSTTQYRYVIYVIKSLKGLSNKIIRLKGNVNVSGTSRTCNYSLGICDKNGDNRTQKVSGNNEEINFTVSAEEANSGKYFYVGLYLTTNVSVVSTDYTDFTNMMLTVDDENMVYIPHNGQLPPLNLGVRNLLNLVDGVYTKDGYSVICQNNVITPQFTTINSNFAINIPIQEPIILKAKKYTLNSNTGKNYPYFGLRENTTQFINSTNGDYGKKTFELMNEKVVNDIQLYFSTSQMDYGTIKIQLEEGDIAHSFNPYGQEPVEYCAIGDYKDEFFYNSSKREDYIDTLENNKWYLKKNVEKVVLDGSENWEYNSECNYFRCPSYNFDNNIPLKMTNNIKPQYNQYCNLFTINKNWNGPGSFRDSTTTQGIFYPLQNEGYKVIFRNTDYTNVNDFKNWLSTHNTEVYYVLATPQYILLNDTLQKQLTDIAKTLSYDEETNISQGNEELPFQISASTLRDINSMFESLETRIAELETA